MQRIPLLLTATLLPACATDVASTGTTEQHASKPYLAESRRCDPNFCILFRAQDSDHDGVADDDEKAAGTDPNDPTKYPTMIDLAKLMAAHELPTWEVGNSLMVLLPTRDVNGLPVFGGGAYLPARKKGIETAGIKIPDGIDIERGFTMSRTVESNEMSFGQLFTAFGRENEGAMPVRLFADAIGYAGWQTTGAGTLEGKTRRGHHLTGTWSNDAWSVSNDDLTFSQSVQVSRDADGNLTTLTSTEQLLGEIRKATNTVNVRSKDGRFSVTTTQTSTTTPYESGTYTEPREPRITVCDYGDCTEEPPEPVDPPDTDPEVPADDDEDYGYIDPEAAEQTGVLTASPVGMRNAIAKLGATILVVPRDNDPLSNYELPPGGIHDAYGPIALYGGDPDAAGFGVTPAFVRVPQPEFDPNLTEQKPPMNAPPDGTCTYCFQRR